MRKLTALSFLIFMTACSTVGGAYDAGRTVVTGTVDAVVTGTSSVVSSVTEDVVDVVAFTGDTAAGIVASTSEYIDKETDEIQEEEEAKK
tara:strand:+ start:763 stop:1032 length:270 start_codon:yes stop_codon:yes gene_type:complete